MYQLKKALDECRTILLRVLVFLCIICLCLLFSFVIVFPLWKLAVTHTKIYTTVSLCTFCAVFLYFFIKRIIKKYRDNPHYFFYGLIKRAVILSGVVLFLVLIFKTQRIAAFSVLAASGAVYLFLLFGHFENEQ